MRKTINKRLAEEEEGPGPSNPTADETHSQNQPSLEIQPKGPQITKAVGSSLALTCTPNVENPRLISQLEWRDPKNRRIDITNSEASLYIKRLNGEAGAMLIFSKLTENLGGVYTCAASYANSEQLVSSIGVNTIVDITWVDAPESQYPVSGKNYKIRCEVKANPAPVVNWLKNGEDIDLSSTERYIIENNGLTITNVKESDDGVYTCRAVVFSTGQIDTRNIKVEVQIPPFIYPIPVVDTVEGIEASVVCNGTGKPLPTYTWIKENTREDLANSDRFTVKKSSGLLIIHRVEFNDNSYYKCIAENPAGRNETRVKINVLVKPKIFEFLNITAPVETDTKIICKASGRPVPKISFRKLSNREPFANGPQFADPRIFQEQVFDDEKGETVATLGFTKLNRSDDGLYLCIAENKVEAAYKNGHITVEFPPTFERTANYPPVWSWDNRPGNLSCIAESIPNATIQWKFNGIIIENGRSDAFQIYGMGPQSYLLVKPFEPRFYTTYECIATNKLGTAVKSVELRKATVPGPIQQARAMTVTATTVKFSIVGPPNYLGLPLRYIVVQYQSDREQGWSTARDYKWSYNPNSTYILENLIPEEVYNFHFAAINDVGIGGWAGDQQIRMPKRSVPAEPKFVIEGSIPDSNDINYITTDLVTSSRYADHYRIQWTVPNDNGDPLDYYIIKYCVSQKVNGAWRDSESECSEEISQSFLYTSYDMNTLRPDTTYKIELQAHNAIGLSTKAELRVKTARGGYYGSSTRSALCFTVTVSIILIVYADWAPLYENEDTSISSSAIIGIVVAAVLLIIILVDVMCCCINRAGIIAFISDQCHSKSVDDEDPKLGSEEKEPLKSESKDQPAILMNGEKCNISVEFDGKQVYTTTGEIIGKHSVV